MARMADARRMYGADKVTNTPERLITMLYDRLVRDLVAAEQAIADGDRSAANAEIVHAQEIIVELLSSLDVKAWSGAAQLAQLYSWLLQQTLHANMHQDVELLVHCRQLVEPLADAWHQAAARLATRSVQQQIDTIGGQIGAAV